MEDSFRTEKHDLGMRPIFHHKQDRTQAHILVCFLALTMWRTLQQWMKASGLGTAPRKLLEELRELKSLDVLLPTREKNHQTQDGGNPGKGTQGAASENEDSSPQQTKDHRKCSDENGLIFIVTT